MFLRGINVGGHRKVPMADLRALVTDVTGDQKVKSYIASGNVLFCADRDRRELSAKLSEAISGRFGFAVPILLFTADELSEVLAHCPWPAADGKTVHAYLCTDTPRVDGAQVTRWATQSEELIVQNQVVWLYTPMGYGKSKLAARVAFGVDATARNLNTLRACQIMAEMRN